MYLLDIYVYFKPLDSCSAQIPIDKIATLCYTNAVFIETFLGLHTRKRPREQLAQRKEGKNGRYLGSSSKVPLSSLRRDLKWSK